MAKSDNNIQIVNELWQKIFNLTQDEKISAISSDIKAYAGDSKWIIHVPGLCKISLKLDGGMATPKAGGAQESAIEGMEDETGFNTGLKPSPNADVDAYTQDFDYQEK
jgi:hypothetical protein